VELLQSLQQALADLEPLVVERHGSAWLRIRAPAIRESAVSCRGGASNGSDLEGALYIRNIVSRVELDNADLALIDWAVLEVENCALPNLVLALDMRRRWWFTRFCSFSGVCQTDGWLVLFAKYPASPTLRARGLAPLLSEWKALTDIRPPSYLHVAPGFLFSVHFFFFTLEMWFISCAPRVKMLKLWSPSLTAGIPVQRTELKENKNLDDRIHVINPLPRLVKTSTRLVSSIFSSEFL